MPPSHTPSTAQKSLRLPSTQPRPQPLRRRMMRMSTFSAPMMRRRMLRLPVSVRRD
jgi:hypothetical protein